MVPRHYGVRNERYKLMHFYQFDEWEFYDLETDPDELQNRYEDPEYADEVAAMKVELERLRTVYDDDSDVAELPAEQQQELRTPSTITRAG
jgi:arylsulfatase A-like enzyme